MAGVEGLGFSPPFTCRRTISGRLPDRGVNPLHSTLSRRRSASVRAEVDFVNGEEAKRLFTEAGFVVLDVRDGTHFQRSHIKSCSHVPLFIENKDNDLGTIINRSVHNNFSCLFGLLFTEQNPEQAKKLLQLSPAS